MTKGQLNTFCSQLSLVSLLKVGGSEERIRGEHEGDEVAHVHGIATRSAASIEVEWLALLVPVEDEVEVATRVRKL